jgi:hypothetical protein
MKLWQALRLSLVVGGQNMIFRTVNQIDCQRREMPYGPAHKLLDTFLSNHLDSISTPLFQRASPLTRTCQSSQR